MKVGASGVEKQEHGMQETKATSANSTVRRQGENKVASCVENTAVAARDAARHHKQRQAGSPIQNPVEGLWPEGQQEERVHGVKPRACHRSPRRRRPPERPPSN